MDLKERARELEEFRRRAAEYENRIQIMNAEIERLNQVLRTKVDSEEGLAKKNRTLINDIEIYKAKIVEIEQSLNQDMQYKIKNYEQRTLSLTQ